jgi:hypothetical protein
MITNQKIDVGDVEYSKLSRVLRFTVAANEETIKTIEDIAHRNDMSIEEVAHHMRDLLHAAIQTHYTRGGLRRQYN